MAKRRLSKHQTRRIKNNQDANVIHAKEDESLTDHVELGPKQQGRVIAHYGSQVEVESNNSDIVRCFLRANLDNIVTGDRVIWQKLKQKDKAGVVVSFEKRRSLLSRPDSFGNLKPVAANVDQIIITVAPQPELFTNLIDRYFVISEINNIRPVLLINKSDLIDDSKLAHFEEIKSLYQNLGYVVLSTSVKKDRDLDELKSILARKTSIFVGQSGVGKSSIIQRLVPDESILIGTLSGSKTKGRHTTTHSQLFRFVGGGDCIDSPGIREFGLWHLNERQIIQGFPELKELEKKCKFRDCKHQNEPGCALTSALEQLEITSKRFESYRRIVQSLNDVKVKIEKD